MAKKISQDLKDACRIVTPEFRVSYPHVLKAAQVNGKGDPKYSITMLFSKKAKLGSIRAAIKAAKVVEFGEDESDWPEDLESPVVDGDHKKHADKEGYKGHWVVKATSQESQRPGLVDENVDPITDASTFYPGCYAHAQVFARVWEYMGKQGVHFILDHVQKTRDGKSFGGKQAVDKVFNPIAVEADDESEEDDNENSFM